MTAQISMKVQIGPMVSLQIDGHSCKEISEALEGWERLNHQLEGLCGGLAENAYPEQEHTEHSTGAA
jgi:hypothetical protein